jgi:polysaccharide export outer membrane protein
MYRQVHTIRVSIVTVLTACVLLVTSAAAQKPTQPPATPSGNGTGTAPPLPADYVIGVDDILTIAVYGQDPKYSGDVTVRPDGKITLLLIDEIVASGRTPVQLRGELIKAYSKFFQEPVIHVSAKEIRSRRVYIVGMVMRPGYYYMNDSMNVLQLIAVAGGLHEFASKEDITIVRKDPLPNGAPDRITFDYNKVFDLKNREPIPQLKPGDQVVVR